VILAGTLGTGIIAYFIFKVYKDQPKPKNQENQPAIRMIPQEINQIRDLTQVIPPTSFPKIYRYQKPSKINPANLIQILFIFITVIIIGILSWISLISTEVIQNLIILVVIGFMVLFLQVIIIMLHRFYHFDKLHADNPSKRSLAVTLTIFSAISIILASIYKILIQNNVIKTSKLSNGLILSLGVLGCMFIIIERLIFIKNNKRYSQRKQDQTLIALAFASQPAKAHQKFRKYCREVYV